MHGSHDNTTAIQYVCSMYLWRHSREENEIVNQVVGEWNVILLTRLNTAKQKIYHSWFSRNTVRCKLPKDNFPFSPIFHHLPSKYVEIWSSLNYLKMKKRRLLGDLWRHLLSKSPFMIIQTTYYIVRTYYIEHILAGLSQRDLLNTYARGVPQSTPTGRFCKY